jgi:hypothetical protein
MYLNLQRIFCVSLTDHIMQDYAINQTVGPKRKIFLST